MSLSLLLFVLEFPLISAACAAEQTRTLLEPIQSLGTDPAEPRPAEAVVVQVSNVEQEVPEASTQQLLLPRRGSVTKPTTGSGLQEESNPRYIGW